MKQQPHRTCDEQNQNKSKTKSRHTQIGPKKRRLYVVTKDIASNVDW